MCDNCEMLKCLVTENQFFENMNRSRCEGPG